MGAEGDWLWRDPFAVHSPPPILMYPTDLLAGHVGALLGLTPRTAFIVYHPIAAVLLLLAVWILLGQGVPPVRRPWLTLCAFGASGLYWLDALLALRGSPPVSLTRMGMEQLSGFNMGLMVAHEGTGMAGQIAAFAALLGLARKPFSWRLVSLGAAGTLLVALAFPVLLPLTLGVAYLYALWTGLLTWHAARHARYVALVPAVVRPLEGAVLITLPGIPLAFYNYYVFSHGVWQVFRGLGALNPVEGLLTWGWLLPLACWGWRAAPRATRPLADLLALWCVCAVAGTILNLYQGSRLATGITIPLGMLIGMALLGRSATIRRRWLIVLALGQICQYLFLLSALLGGQAPHLYNRPDQEAAIRWLAAHTVPRDVVLAPFSFGNVLPEAMRAHVVAGEYDQTYDFAVRYPQLQTFYGSATPAAARARVLRATQANYVVYDRQETLEGTFDPVGMPGLRAVFASGGVVVLRVEP